MQQSPTSEHGVDVALPETGPVSPNAELWRVGSHTSPIDAGKADGVVSERQPSRTTRAPRRGPHHEVARRAGLQYGILTRAQLLECGFTAAMIGHRARTGWLWRMYRGVYAVGYPPSSPDAQAMAALLACGPGAALSHRSAAALWKITKTWPSPVEVTAQSAHRMAGLRAHRSRTLAARDVTRHRGLWVTTPARTLIDLADILDDAALIRALNEAEVVRGLSLPELSAQIDRARGRRGAPRLRRWIEESDAPTRSAFEDEFLAFAKRFGLPRPEVNQLIAGRRVDMLWRWERLIVELDGYQFHGHATAFERDRERDADLILAGYVVLRLTWRRLRLEPEREAERLRLLLSERAQPPTWTRAADPGTPLARPRDG